MMVVVMAVMMVISRLRTSESTNSSISAARVMVKYNEVDGGKSGAVGKLVEKSCQKVEELSKVEKPQRPEKSQKSSVRRNIYRNTNPPSIRYKELKLPLEFWQFIELFLLGPKSSLEATSTSIIDKAQLMKLLMLFQSSTRHSEWSCWYSFDYWQGTANGAADALSIIDKAQLMELLMLFQSSTRHS